MSLDALLERLSVTPVTSSKSTDVTAPDRAITEGYASYVGYVEKNKGEAKTDVAPPKPCVQGDSGYLSVDENRQRRTIEIKVSGVTGVTANDPPPLSADDRTAIHEAIEERAAILEFDGGLPRAKADVTAQSAMRVYQALVTLPDGSSPRWLTLLAPGCDLTEARDTLNHQFGVERVLDVKEQQP